MKHYFGLDREATRDWGGVAWMESQHMSAASIGLAKAVALVEHKSVGEVSRGFVRDAGEQRVKESLDNGDVTREQLDVINRACPNTEDPEKNLAMRLALCTNSKVGS